MEMEKSTHESLSLFIYLLCQYLFSHILCIALQCGPSNSYLRNNTLQTQSLVRIKRNSVVWRERCVWSVSCTVPPGSVILHPPLNLKHRRQTDPRCSASTCVCSWRCAAHVFVIWEYASMCNHASPRICECVSVCVFVNLEVGFPYICHILLFIFFSFLFSSPWRFVPDSSCGPYSEQYVSPPAAACNLPT